MTKKNEPAFLAVEEMATHSLSLEQKRAQIARGNKDVVRYGDTPKKPLENYP